MSDYQTIKRNLYEQVSTVAKAISNPRRLEIIALLSQAPMSVETLATEVEISLKLASAHLKELRSARLVEFERQGKQMVYRLAHPDVARLSQWLRLMAEDRLFDMKAIIGQTTDRAPVWNLDKKAELEQKAIRGELVVIDVRPANEYQVAHLPFAQSMPLDELPELMIGLPKSKPIVVYCRGTFCFKSVTAVDLLRQGGYDAFQLRDGVVEWNSRKS